MLLVVGSPNTVATRSFTNRVGALPAITIFTTSTSGLYRVTVTGIGPVGFGPAFSLAYTDLNLGKMMLTLPQIFLQAGATPVPTSPFTISCTPDSDIVLESGNSDTSTVYHIYTIVEQF